MHTTWGLPLKFNRCRVWATRLFSRNDQRDHAHQYYYINITGFGGRALILTNNVVTCTESSSIMMMIPLVCIALYRNNPLVLFHWLWRPCSSTHKCQPGQLVQETQKNRVPAFSMMQTGTRN